MAKKIKQPNAPSKQSISEEVKTRVNEIVETFNKNEPMAKKCPYVARFQGKYLYLDRRERSEVSPICRLKYTGKLDDWDFAIYKYSRDVYDAEEWFFPGSQHIDGTVEGAMRAGLEAYPCRTTSPLREALGCLLFIVWFPWQLVRALIVAKLLPKATPPSTSDAVAGEERPK